MLKAGGFRKTSRVFCCCLWRRNRETIPAVAPLTMMNCIVDDLKCSQSVGFFFVVVVTGG